MDKQQVADLGWGVAGLLFVWAYWTFRRGWSTALSLAQLPVEKQGTSEEGIKLNTPMEIPTYTH